MSDFAKSILSVIVGGVLAVSGQYLASSRDYNAKMVEIAVGVLRAEPKPEIEGARAWAIRIIDQSAPDTLTKEEAEALVKHALPFEPSQIVPLL